MPTLIAAATRRPNRPRRLRTAFASATVLAASALTGAAPAQASTIVQSLTFAPLSGYNSENGTPISLFDPSLGMLTAVTINTRDTVTFTGGGATDFNSATIRFTLAGEFFAENAATRGNGSAPAFTQYTPSSSVNGSFTGTGLFTPMVSVTRGGPTSATPATVFGAADNLTYTYTPAAPTAVSEPVSAALLGAGLLGVAGLVRRRQH